MPDNNIFQDLYNRHHENENNEIKAAYDSVAQKFTEYDNSTLKKVFSFDLNKTYTHHLLLDLQRHSDSDIEMYKYDRTTLGRELAANISRARIDLNHYFSNRVIDKTQQISASSNAYNLTKAYLLYIELNQVHTKAAIKYADTKDAQSKHTMETTQSQLQELASKVAKTATEGDKRVTLQTYNTKYTEAIDQWVTHCHTQQTHLKKLDNLDKNLAAFNQHLKEDFILPFAIIQHRTQKLHQPDDYKAGLKAKLRFQKLYLNALDVQQNNIGVNNETILTQSIIQGSEVNKAIKKEENSGLDKIGKERYQLFCNIKSLLDCSNSDDINVNEFSRQCEALEELKDYSSNENGNLSSYLSNKEFANLCKLSAQLISLGKAFHYLHKIASNAGILIFTENGYKSIWENCFAHLHRLMESIEEPINNKSDYNDLSNIVQYLKKSRQGILVQATEVSKIDTVKINAEITEDTEHAVFNLNVVSQLNGDNTDEFYYAKLQNIQMHNQNYIEQLKQQTTQQENSLTCIEKLGQKYQDDHLAQEAKIEELQKKNADLLAEWKKSVEDSYTTVKNNIEQGQTLLKIFQDGKKFDLKSITEENKKLYVDIYNKLEKSQDRVTQNINPETLRSKIGGILPSVSNSSSLLTILQETLENIVPTINKIVDAFNRACELVNENEKFATDIFEEYRKLHNDVKNYLKEIASLQEQLNHKDKKIIELEQKLFEVEAKLKEPLKVEKTITIPDTIKNIDQQQEKKKSFVIKLILAANKQVKYKYLGGGTELDGTFKKLIGPENISYKVTTKVARALATVNTSYHDTTSFEEFRENLTTALKDQELNKRKLGRTTATCQFYNNLDKENIESKLDIYAIASAC
ncbi:hypothetical protein [Facilibium subflavum]|uniref:hypothetical protein n=1 Tax=Facilibium subflavum TaxID=2219058 RepID=UPI000E6583F0|nr:hypothetical protein [Facilibium subflavum]